MTSDRQGERRLDLARWLLQAGAAQSARNVLGELLGARANRIRLDAEHAALAPGVYGLMSLPSATHGAVVPLRATPGHPRAEDSAFRDACLAAHALASRVLDAGPLPMLRFELEEELTVFGPSVGLPALLAFLAYFAPSRAPAVAVLATGEITSDGRVMRVGRLDAKYEVARAERRASVLIFPREEQSRAGVFHVDTTSEALVRVFGTAPLAPDPELTVIEALVRRARTAPSAADGADLLNALDATAAAPADRVRLLFEQGTLRRNAGESAAAWTLHHAGAALLDGVRQTLGADLTERYELESYCTALDRFRLHDTIEATRQRLTRPFTKSRNELRCRGMLAQGLAMSGKFEEALAVRRESLSLHAHSEALRRQLPATLCHLTLDAALAGDAGLFDAYAHQLCQATLPGDEPQRRFNAATLVRGMVQLERCERAIAWAHGESRLYDVQAPATLVLATHAPLVVTAPEVSAMRALVRALRRVDRLPEAIALAAQVADATMHARDLFGWTAGLVRLERALIHPDAALLARAQENLVAQHPEATEAHARLLSKDVVTIEQELDRVWY